MLRPKLIRFLQIRCKTASDAMFVLIVTVLRLIEYLYTAWAKSKIFGRPLVKRFALCYQTVVCLVCPVYDVGVLWPNGWMDQDVT